MNAVIYEYPDGTLQVEDTETRFVYAIAVADPGCQDVYVILDPALAASELAEVWGDPELPAWLAKSPDLAQVLASLNENGYTCYRGWVTPSGEIVTLEAVR